LIHVDGNPKPGDPPPRRSATATTRSARLRAMTRACFVIFLDDYHTRLGSSLAVRNPLSEFIQKPDEAAGISWR
jgi:hypothetical protein